MKIRSKISKWTLKLQQAGQHADVQIVTDIKSPLDNDEVLQKGYKKVIMKEVEEVKHTSHHFRASGGKKVLNYSL